jgi:hypothetical protein
MHEQRPISAPDSKPEECRWHSDHSLRADRFVQCLNYPPGFLKLRWMSSPSACKFSASWCKSSPTTRQFTIGGRSSAVARSSPFCARPLIESYANVAAAVSRAPIIIPNTIFTLLLQGSFPAANNAATLYWFLIRNFDACVSTFTTLCGSCSNGTQICVVDCPSGPSRVQRVHNPAILGAESKEVHMDRNRMEGNWKRLKGRVEAKWGKRADDDGRRDQP